MLARINVSKMDAGARPGLAALDPRAMTTHDGCGMQAPWERAT